MSKLKLEFVMAATNQINDAINFFEQRETMIHLVRGKMEDVLRNQILKFHSDSAVKNTEDGNVIKKSGDELLNVDPGDTKTMLNKQRVFIGQKCVNLLKDLGLSPTSPQVNWFYEKVYRFHQRVTDTTRILQDWLEEQRARIY